MVADLEGVTYISSAGVGALVIGMIECRDNGGDLVISSPNVHVKQVLTLLGLGEMFEIVDSPEQASLSGT